MENLSKAYALAPKILFVVGVVYSSIFLLNLRYATGDDVTFDILATLLKGKFFQFGLDAAYHAGRAGFLIKIPMQLYFSSLTRSWLSDFINIGSFALLWISLFLMLRVFCEAASASVITGFCTFLFPLHFYYTIPHGYGPPEYFGFISVFLLCWACDFYLRTGSRLVMILCVGLLLASLAGSETNFGLAPCLVGLAAVRRKGNPGSRIRLLSALMATWLVSCLVYGGVVFYHTDNTSHIVPGFSPTAFAQTFAILARNAILPFALIDGIHINSGSLQGIPNTPRILSYGSIIENNYVLRSCVLATIVFSCIIYIPIREQRLNLNSLSWIAVLACIILIIPLSILSTSSAVQINLSLGYMQGHIISFLTQLGAWILFCAVLCGLCNVASGKARMVRVAISSILISALICLTFRYDLITREAMNANMQRWSAFRLIADFSHMRPGAAPGRTFYAPAFWVPFEVSGVPHSFEPYFENYWDTYADRILGEPLHLAPWDSQDEPGATYATYFPEPSGNPIVVLADQEQTEGQRSVTVITRHPFEGAIDYVTMDHQSKTRLLEGWLCAEVCVIRFGDGVKPDSLVVRNADEGSRSLAYQYLHIAGTRFGRF